MALDHLKKEQRLKRKGLDTVPLEPTPDFSVPRRQAAARPHVSLPSDSTPTRPDPKEARRRLGRKQVRDTFRGEQDRQK